MKEGKDLSPIWILARGRSRSCKRNCNPSTRGYSIFLEAKDLIAPKKEISAKKTKLRKEMDGLEKEIEHLELRLSMANLNDDQRSKMTLSISSKKGTLKELKEEMEALLNFDHTRFVEAR